MISVYLYCSNNMKAPIVICLIITIVAGLAAEQSAPCKPKPCRRNYRPVCGQRIVGEKLEKKVFPNSCLMENANNCGGGYEICTEMPVEEDNEQLEPTSTTYKYR